MNYRNQKALKLFDLNLDLNLIKTFLEVYRCQSYTIAAQHIGISQPAVSAAIKRMENELGRKLFIKSGRGIAPTSLANKLAQRFQLAFNEIQNALVEQNTFNIYVYEALTHVLGNLDNTTCEETPLDQYEVLHAIKNQTIDMAIGVFTIKDNSMMNEVIANEPAVVICRQDHPRIKGSISKDEFYREEHCISAAKWDNMQGFEHGALEPVRERKVNIVASSIAGMALHISQRECLGVISKAFARKWQQTLKLQVLDCPVPLRDLNYSLLYHRRFSNDSGHKALREQIKMKLKVI